MATRLLTRTVLLVLIGAGTIFGSGCGGGTMPATQPPTSISHYAIRQSSAPVAWQLAAGGNRDHQAFQGLDFYTDSITIDEGDSVTWTVGGNAHTITFFGPLTTPRLPVFLPYGGSTYDGSVYTSSGAVVTGNTYTLTFPKAGTYPYECLFHDPEMAGVIIVQPKGAPYPHSQTFYTAKGLAELTRQLDGAVGALDEFPYPDHGTTLAAGIAPGLSSSPPTHSTVLRFIDADNIVNTVTIPVGTTLTWFNLSNNEPHTVTFPKAGHPIPQWLLNWPFGPALGGSNYNGSELTNSGPLFPGQSYSLKFTAKGDFTYECLVHGFVGMAGMVSVR